MSEHNNNLTSSRRDGISRRQFVRGSAAATAAMLILKKGPTSLWASTIAPSELSHPAAIVRPRAPLAEVPFMALPLGSVRPQGWVLKQLELQRDGLTGYADEVLPSLDRASSAWLIGDNTSGEDWEKGPYYAKGLVALAYTLNDDRLKGKASEWVEAILKSQRPDGFYGPKNDDWWPRIVANYLLRDYAEATGDDRVPKFLASYYNYQSKQLPERPLKEWGKARAGDEIDTVLWLYNRSGDASLLELADLLYAQAYPWREIFTENRFLDFPNDFHPKHAVNVAQALKAPVVYWQRSGLAADRESYRAALSHLAADHGTSFGINTGTEFVSGRSTVDGVELCAIAENMLSAATALRVLGDVRIGDELELVAFNALPAALSKTFRQHVYYTLANSVSAKRGSVGYEIDYVDGRTPAPRSGCPCCCYNLHMAWPKLVQNSWAATLDGGLAALVYLPSEVAAPVAGGKNAHVSCNSQYPFEESIALTVHVDEPAKFPLHLRLPTWCQNPSLKINGVAHTDDASKGFAVIDRHWSAGDTVELTFPMQVSSFRGANNSVSLRRGPLVYSLAMEEEWTAVDKGSRPGFESYEVTSPTAWNYALVIDDSNPEKSVETIKRPGAANPFETGKSSLVLRAKAQRIDSWKLRDDGLVPLDPPFSPVSSDAPVQTIELTPFGSQMLRITDFPVIGEPAAPLRQWTDKFASGIVDDWVIYRGGFLRDGRLNLVRGSKGIVGPSSFDDLSFEGEVQVGDAGDGGLIFRVTSPSIGVDHYKGYYVGIDASARAVLIGKADNKWIPLARESASISAGNPHRVRIEARGPEIRVWLDDSSKPLLQVRDDSFAAGSIGVRSYADRAAFRKLTAYEMPRS
jgi:Beta-L-arabinofuranosidase, GH127/Domain of Unknown Function (DUF1080)